MLPGYRLVMAQVSNRLNGGDWDVIDLPVADPEILFSVGVSPVITISDRGWQGSPCLLATRRSRSLHPSAPDNSQGLPARALDLVHWP